jgi:hypothetical protein
MVLIKRNSADIGWTYGTIPFARNEAHDKVVEMMEKGRRKRKMVWLLPLVCLIRLCGRMASKKRREHYRLDETIKNEIIMGGSTLIILGERVA